ncbi:type II secretion system protein [Candidatus Saccharibacteria bacterium]|nr:type II secretion system protein [Candidatus Saccharibacteria bacterium]
MPKQLTNQSERKGFTIIEVVLVLAIAGLIFLMVFVALPALQRSQRDTARRNDIARLSTALAQWQTNNTSSSDPNNLPDASSWAAKAQISSNDCNNDACKIVREYMNTTAATVDGEVTNTFADPDGTLYNVVIGGNISGPATPSNLKSPENQDLATLTWADGKYDLSGNDTYKAHTIFIVPGAKCDKTSIVKSDNRRYALIYQLEGSGVYCLDDQ